MSNHDQKKEKHKQLADKEAEKDKEKNESKEQWQWREQDKEKEKETEKDKEKSNNNCVNQGDPKFAEAPNRGSWSLKHKSNIATTLTDEQESKHSNDVLSYFGRKNGNKSKTKLKVCMHSIYHICWLLLIYVVFVGRGNIVIVAFFYRVIV